VHSAWNDFLYNNAVCSRYLQATSCGGGGVVWFSASGNAQEWPGESWPTICTQISKVIIISWVNSKPRDISSWGVRKPFEASGIQVGYLEVTVQEKLCSGWPSPFVKDEGCRD
jgi:hypothetical protein